jgi:hypothetical protein
MTDRQFRKLQRKFVTMSQTGEPVVVEQHAIFHEAVTMGGAHLCRGRTFYQLEDGEPVTKSSDTEFEAPMSKLTLTSEEPIIEEED